MVPSKRVVAGVKSLELPKGYGTFYCDDNGPVPRTENEAFLVSVVRLLKPKKLVEIGVLVGETTVCLAYNMPADAVLYGLDIDIERPRALIEFMGMEKRIILLPGISQESAKSLPDGIDFAYIDGGHGYEEVRDDTAAIWHKLSEGAVVAFHDANSPSVSRFLEEAHSDAIRFLWSHGLAIVQKPITTNNNTG